MKKDLGYYDEIMNSYSGKDDPQKKPSEGGRVNQGELTGDELKASVSPELWEMAQLKKGRPRRKTLQEEKASIRSSFVLKALQVEKLRFIALKENITITALVEEAFRNAIAAYEKKNGEIVFSEEDKPNVRNSAEGLFS